MPTLTPSHERFLFTRLASLRAKQLLHGATPRIQLGPAHPPASRIAREELIRGLVAFRTPRGLPREHLVTKPATRKLTVSECR